MSRTGLVALIVANLFVALQTLRHEWGYYETILIKFGGFALAIGLFVLLLPAALDPDPRGGGVTMHRALGRPAPLSWWRRGSCA
jgi:hypothetical protein